MNEKQVRFCVDTLETKLCNAIKEGNVLQIKKLLKCGINVNCDTPNSSGLTPMHWACGLGDYQENAEIIDLLMSNNGNPNITSTEGLTPVHVAASWGHLVILKKLINNGGDPWMEDSEGCNSWDLALQKNQWKILGFLSSYMDEDHAEPKESSVSLKFLKYREVTDTAFLYNSSLSSNSNNVGFMDSVSSNSISSFYSTTSVLNNALCASTMDSTITSNSVVVEEYVYTDKEKGIDLIEWHYPPLINQDSVIDGTLNDALCTSDDHDELNQMDSLLLLQELKSLGSNPGPITASTKHLYLRQLYRLRKDCSKTPPRSPTQSVSCSKELKTIMRCYPGQESEVKVATHLDRLLVTHFTCPDPTKPWREGLAKKSFNYILLDSRVTHNLPLNESQDQSTLFKRFISSVFYIGKGKQTRPYEHLYDAIKTRSRLHPVTPFSGKIQRILDIWDDGQGVISIHVFQNSLPVEAYCREAAMIDAIGLSSITNAKRGNYYGLCTSWSDSDRRRWGAHLLYKAFHIFLHEGERQIRPVDL